MLQRTSGCKRRREREREWERALDTETLVLQRVFLCVYVCPLLLQHLHWVAALFTGLALCISARDPTTTTITALWLVVDCRSSSRCHCFKKKLHGNSVVILYLEPLIWEGVHWKLGDHSKKQNFKASWDWDSDDWQGEQKRLSYLCFARSLTLRVKDVMVWGTTGLMRINGLSRLYC